MKMMAMIMIVIMMMIVIIMIQCLHVTRRQAAQSQQYDRMQLELRHATII